MLNKKLTTTKKVFKGKRSVYRKRPVAQRVPMKKTLTGNIASVQEQFSLGITAGVMYDFKTTLNDLTRGLAVAKAYQYYRITSVEMRFKPYFDTYNNGLSSGQTIPYLYFQYDKSGALSGGITAAQMEQIGTKAIRLDEKTIIRRWRPSVPTETQLGTTSFKVSPWLPVLEPLSNTVNFVDHYGAVFYISKTLPTDATVYDVDVIVNLQCRKPLVYIPNGNSSMSVNPPRINQTNETVAGPVIE